MVDATIKRNLQIFSDRAYIRSYPCARWEYRILKYHEPQNYEVISDWAEYTPSVSFNTDTTFAARTIFVPAPPIEGELAFLSIITAQSCEAIVKVNGVSYGGINASHGRTRIYLPKECYGRETSIEIELFASNHARGDWNTCPLTKAEWVIADKEIYDFQQSMTLLSEVIAVTSNRYKKEKLKELLVHIINECDQSLTGEEYREDIARLNELLKKGLAEIGGDNDKGEVDLVASTHIDTAWLWQFKDTVRKASRSALIQLRLMDKYPEYQFSFSQPSVYNFIKDNYPDVYAQIKQKIADGQWVLLGPMWVEGDLNISGGEAIIREFLYGHSFFKNEFGKTSNVCWIPDSFGFPANLPQIFKKCGTESFFTTKVRWQAAVEFPYTFFSWEGIDGTRITSTIPKLQGFYNGQINPQRVMLASDGNQQRSVHDKILMPYGFGDGGGGPTEFMLDYYRKMQDYPGMPAIKLTTAEEYFNELDKKSDILPVWKGELCVETHQGTYTTIAKNKRANRYGEMAMRRLDLLAALANIKAHSEQYREIIENWKSLLLMQFHDVLPGSSIDAVYDDTDRLYKKLFDFAEKEQKELIDSAFSPVNDESCVTVFNPNSFEASAYVRVDDTFKGCTLSDGKNASKVIPDGKGGYVFFAQNVEGFGAKVYSKVKSESKNSENCVTLTDSANGYHAETPFFSFDINNDGTLHNFFDKVEKITYSSKDGLNCCRVYKDGPEYEDAWNIDRDFKLRPVDMKWLNSCEIVENNGERSVVRVTKKSTKTTVIQDIIIYSKLNRVDFSCHINWNEKYRLMQVTFPTAINAPYASYEIAYGICKRTAHPNTPGERWKHEYAAHRFVDLSDEKRGAALINDCKYGHNAIDGEITMTLFRNTDYPSSFLDTGEHDYAYSFLPHSGGVYSGNVAKEAYLFNSPMFCFNGKSEIQPIIALSDDSLFIDCIKPAEDGNGIIVRMYEPYGTSGTTKAALSKCAYVSETSPLEETVAKLGSVSEFDISFTPFEIKTFRIV